MARCDGIVCCLGCMSLVPGLQQRVVSKMAFAPPPSSYRIECGKTYIKDAYGEEFLMPTRACVKNEDTEICIDSFILTTNMGNEVPCFSFFNPRAKTTMIFSHGNSTDIGHMFPHLLDLCLILNVNVVAYEYSGYGFSTGEASEAGIYSDIQAAYDYVIHRQDVPPNQVVLYGQSVGSAASIDLASKEPVGGLIVHSGIKSGLTVLRSNYEKIHWFDAFKNLEKMKAVTSPVFVIHGSGDSEVKLDHGKALFDAAPAKTKKSWWVGGAGHNDIETVRRRSYFQRIMKFLRQAGLEESSFCSAALRSPQPSSSSTSSTCATSPRSSVSNLDDDDGKSDDIKDKRPFTYAGESTIGHNGILLCSRPNSPKKSKPRIVAYPRSSYFRTKADVERRHGRCRMPNPQWISAPMSPMWAPSEATFESGAPTPPSQLTSARSPLGRIAALSNGASCSSPSFAPQTHTAQSHSPRPPIMPHLSKARGSLDATRRAEDDGSVLPILPSLCLLESRYSIEKS